MTVEDWLDAACADADRRGIPDLKPLLVSLAEATKALRSAGWDDDPGRTGSASGPSAPASTPGSADGGAAR